MKGLELNAEGDRAEILLYAPIGGSFWDEGITAKAFNEMLDEVINVSVINLRLNSPGGEVFEGVAIYNSLLRHSARVEVDIEGAAFSIASVIAMAGDEVRIAESAMMMIHDPRTIVIGTAEDMRKMADHADKAKEGLIAAYHRKVDKEGHDISALMTDESWFTAEEAVAIGLADKVNPGSKLENSYDLSKFGFQHVPDALKAKAEPKKKEPTKAEDPKPDNSWKAKHRAREIDLAGVE